MSPCCIPSTALRTADTLGKNLVLARGSLQPAGRGRDKQVISKISFAPPCGPPKPCELLTNFTFLRDVCHLGTVHSRKASWRRRRRLRGAGGIPQFPSWICRCIEEKRPLSRVSRYLSILLSLSGDSVPAHKPLLVLSPAEWRRDRD